MVTKREKQDVNILFWIDEVLFISEPWHKAGIFLPTAQGIRSAMMRSLLVLTMLLMAQPTFGQLDHEQEPINYSNETPTDPVAQLAKRLEAGEIKLEWEPRHGYLTSLMQHLEIPASSQTLVFS